MKLSIQFGALADSLRKQLKSAGMTFKVEEVTHLQRDADDVTRLAVRGLLTEKETNAARRRIMKKLLAAVG